MSGPTHDRDTAVQTLCRDLKLPGVLRHYRNGIVPTDPKDYLRESLEAERTSRREKRLKNLLKGARLPYARTLSEYDFLRLPSLPKEQILSLAQGDFLRRRENLVLLGNSGTGKTHVAIGVAASCIAAGYAVRSRLSHARVDLRPGPGETTPTNPVLEGLRNGAPRAFAGTPGNSA